MPIRRRGGSGGTTDDKTVKASSSDSSPGYLDAKVDGTTLEVSGDKLAVKSTFLATTSAAGLVELATNAETQTGTDTGRAVTPASLKSAVPFKTTATMNLYVNPGAAYGSYGAGSDSNAGTQAAPFATIAAAIAKIPKFLEHNVTIYLAGEPNYYEWKPDGTNGIRFATGDSGVTVAVVAGSSLSVAISGSAVTITLATGGSTIAQIIATITASATVGAVIFPIAVGITSTNITATLSTHPLTGGNVRTYDAAALYCVPSSVVVMKSLGPNYAPGVIIPSLTLKYCNATISDITVAPVSAANTAITVESATGLLWNVRTTAAHTIGISCSMSLIRMLVPSLYGSTATGISSIDASTVYVQGGNITGSGVGISTSGGIVVTQWSVNNAATPTSASPAGTIIGA